MKPIWGQQQFRALGGLCQPWGLVLGFALATVGCSLPSDSSLPGPQSATSLKSISLNSYTASTATLTLVGSLPSSGTTALNRIQFHTQADCSDASIGQGLQSDFSGLGIQIQIPIQGLTSDSTKLYASTNTLSECLFVGQYTFAPGPPNPPTFTSVVPGSPSRISYSPTIFGTALANSTVNFYSDSGCVQQVGSGTSAAFSVTGIATVLSQNTRTTVFGQTLDALGQKSLCVEVTQYQHTTTGPNPPIYGAVSPVTPNKLSTTPVLTGTASVDSVSVSLFSDAGCSTLLGTETAANFAATGIQITVLPNQFTPVYGKALDATGAPSVCTFLVNYQHDNMAPAAPTFNVASPPTPTRLTIYPRLTGFASSDTATVKFFDSIACMTPIGAGVKADFEGAGILVSVRSNDLTSIYAAAVDAAGNSSACVHFLDYRNNTIPPDPPVFGGTDPVSPNNISSTPLIYGNASLTTLSLEFFSDVDCTSLIGSGTAAQFNGSGIQLTTPAIPNSVNITQVFATAIDPEGNVSICAQLTNYGYSTAKAAAASFVQSVPASPSRTVFKPYMLGQAPASVSVVSLFNNSSCTSQIGSASRSAFSTLGMQVTVPVNSSNNIYAVTTDIYGNTSDCTFFTNYIHDDVQPLSPGFLSVTPTSPNNSSITPWIQGSVVVNNPGKILPTSKVNIYDSFMCFNRIGTGTPADFASSGVQISASPNAITNVYAQTADAAGNTSTCTYMLDYIHDTNPPGVPILVSASPMTPSYSQKTTFAGTIAASADIVAVASVKFYSDSLCTVLFGSGAPSQFTSSGIPLVVGQNTTTTVYAQNTDIVGNKSACAHLLDYFHNDLGPVNLLATQNLDGSVSLSWLSDSTASPSPKYIVKRATTAGGPYTILAWQNNGANYTDLSVSNNQTYYYVVAATNNTGVSFNSSETSITISASPTQSAASLQATPGSAVVALQWQGFSPDMYYKVLRATQTGGPYIEIKTGIAGTQYLDDTVVNGNSYYYVVVGTNPTGSSIYSNEASATVIDVPAAPQNLQLTFQSSLAACGGNPGVSLSWSAPAFYTSFVVMRGQTPGNESDRATVNGTTYTDCAPLTHIGAVNDSYYVVRAIWGPPQAPQRSVPSNEVGLVNMPGPAITVNPGDNQIYVKWNVVTNATGYQVWRSTVAGWPHPSYVQLSANFTGSTYLDSTAVNGVAYSYVVISNFPNSCSSLPSAENSGIPQPNPGPPSKLMVAQSSGAPTLVLNWAAPANYNGFNVYRGTALAGPYSYVTTVSNPSFVDSPGTAGIYYYYVTTTWGSFESAGSNIVPYTYGFPATISAAVSGTAITLTWTAVPGASTYKILRSTSSGGPYTYIGSSATSPYANTTTVPASYVATAGVGYFYVVQAVFPDTSLGQFSAEVSGMLTGTTVPSGLTVLATTMSSATLTWAKVDNASKYTVYKSTTAGGTYTAVTPTTTLNSYTVSSLTPGADYFFKVTSTVSGVQSPQSNYVGTSAVGSPAAPSVSAGNNQVTVQWSGVAGANSYNVLRSTDLVSFTNIQSGATGGTYTDATAVNGNLYFYEVQAVFASRSLNSPASAGVTPGITPLIPQGISLIANTTGTDATLSWGAVSGVTTYNIYLSTTSGGPWGSAIQSTSSAAYNVISGLTPNTTYYVAVTALNGSMESGMSTQFSFTTGVTPAAPSVAVSGATIAVNWAIITGAATYDLYRSTNKFHFLVIATGLATTTYTDASVVSGQAYYYQYLPRGAGGEALSLSSVGGPVTPGVIPNAPAQLVLDAVNSTTVNLSWVQTPVSALYNIYRGTVSGGPYSLLTSISSTQLQYQDATPAAGNTYYYVLTSTNADGAESVYSNEVGVNLVSGPASLAATNGANKVNLSWSAVAGANNYVLYRGEQTGGPYGVLANLGAVTSFQDANIKANVTYYYIVDAKFGGGELSLHSNEASITAVRNMNLQVPIELTDQALGSDVSPIIFDRTRTTLDPTAYDGTVTYSFEVLAMNTDSANVDVALVDSGNNVRGTITVPANTTQMTRMRVNFTPNVSADNYRLQLGATTTQGLLQIGSARLFVTQVGATKTKLYIPLLSSANAPNSNDFWAPVESTNSSTYTVLNSSTTYRRDLSHLSALNEYNPWEFEVLVSSTGGTGLIGLYNVNQQAVVNSTESQFSASGSVILVNSPFDDGVTNFASPTNDLNQYRVAMQCYSNCATGSMSVYKAGLWVSLSNLNNVEIIFRNTLATNLINSTRVLDGGRTLIDLSKFSNPVVNYRVTAMAPSGTLSSVELMSNGAADAGTAGLTSVSGASLNFSTMAQQILQTPSPLTLNAQDRYMTKVNTSGGDLIIQESALIIEASP
jgi:fibronectin type 3 domain-containing protein